MKNKRKIVAVIGSGKERHEAISAPLGKWLAEKGYHLINGGGMGVMEATTKAFSETASRAGLTFGIIPSTQICDTLEKRNRYEAPIGYPNKYIDIPIRTHLHLSSLYGTEVSSRNHIIILTADIVIALPGEEGTISETQLALEYNKPLIILNPAYAFNDHKTSSAIIVKTIDKAFQEILKKVPP